jgi:DNA polymerase elongation subunit (family B)
MEKKSFFPYSWHIDDEEKEVTEMRVYGLDSDNKNVCIHINDFTPFIYLELPDNIDWSEGLTLQVGNKIDQILGHKKPIKKYLVYKKRLYYAHLDSKGKTKKFPYLFMSFSNESDIKTLSYLIRTPFNITGIGIVKLKMHEQDASPILQFTSYRNISTAGWIDFVGKKVEKDSKLTRCDHEFRVKWKNVKPNKIPTVAAPLIMGFDIEVNSTNPSAMPNAEKPGDKVFQISCVLFRHGEDEKNMKKFLLTLGEPDPKTVGKDTEIYMYETEHDLLIGYTEFVQEQNPNIIVGYNILMFDIPYMIERAKMNLCLSEFDQQGFTLFSHAKEKTIKWSSKAYGSQTFQFLDAEGRLYVDLLPIVKKNYKMDNYKLKTVSTFFLGSTKDPLSVKGIFKCYRIGINKNKGVYSKRAKKAMGIVGKYCVQDSALVIKLFNKLQTWIGLCEMANTCNVPIFYLYTQGEQIKVYSQLYKYCMYNNFVVEKDGYVPKDNEHFVGATVFTPKAGVYDRVLPFDFASLYPTTIIAYNIDYSTLVIDPSIPDSKCHVMEWEDHIGCAHDKTVRKTKPKHKMCDKRYFRYLKEPKGVMPTVLQNLLDARANTRKQIKIIKNILKGDSIDDIDINLVRELISDVLDMLKNNVEIPDFRRSELKTLTDVLDKRQLAYKISANSMYGAMGVSRGYLPFMPGAMCTTAMGRKNINIVAKVIPEKFGGELIYGDTDSNYIVFPKLKTAEENWDYAEHVAAEVTKMFPSPIKLEFEQEIYWRFFILTKKRYMYKKCYRDGIVDQTIGKKGVLLARRDNSMFIRNAYETLIMKVFNKSTQNDILLYVIEIIDNLCSHMYSYKDFVVTKSIGSSEGDIVPFTNDKGKKKGKFGDYTVPLLSTEPNERNRQYRLKNCDSISDAEKQKDYYRRCLPAIVQLAIRMRQRGQRVDVGTRLEYVISSQGGHKAKQYVKVEDAIYFGQHSSVLKLDYMYYLKLMCNPFDDVLNILFDKDDGSKYKFQKNFVLNQYKYRLRMRTNVLDELTDLFNPNIIFST